MDDYLRSACKSLPSSEHQSSIPHSRRPQCSISTIDTARSDLRLTYHGRETLPDSWGFCSQKILLTEKAVVSVIRYVSNSYAVCGHIMVTHRAFVRKALPNLNSQGPKSWKSPIYSDIYDSIFTSARQGLRTLHIFSQIQLWLRWLIQVSTWATSLQGLSPMTAISQTRRPTSKSFAMLAIFHIPHSRSVHPRISFMSLK